MSLIDRYGRRKYLTLNELLRFIEVAFREPPERSLFALMLVLTGCRISEALALKTASFDLEAGFVIFRTLKQRRCKRPSFAAKTINAIKVFFGRKQRSSKPTNTEYRYRAVRLPENYMDALREYFDLLDFADPSMPSALLWPVNRKTAYRWIKEMMQKAGIHGPHATPHGLRHTFGLNHADDNTPELLVKRLMGHADVRTTQIYQQMYGQEELKYMEAMWKKLKIHNRRNFHL